MTTLLRMIHLLALGTWFGSVTFFSFCTALPIISHLKTQAARPNYWLQPQVEKQGVRMAGDALEPVFIRYFPLQVICGAAAIFTIKAWHGGMPGLGRVRLGLIGLAFLLACLNTFWLAARVRELRNERYDIDEQVAQRAHELFDTWHSYSLWTDMAGLACLAVAFALAALPVVPHTTAPSQPSET
jgi:hypothetical protein